MDLIIAIIGLIGSLITVIGVLISFLNIRKKRDKAIKRNLSSLGAEAFDTIHTDNFIPTMGQDDNPNEELESNNQDGSVKKVRRFLLNKELLQEIQKEKNGVKKLRFFILGGSGMGKTSFLSYFVEKYYRQKLFSLPPYHVYTVYLGSPNCLNDIKSIDRNDSILILDALDENASAVKNVTEFINDMEAVTDRFRFVIISSRTQFFTDRSNIPDISTIIQNGGAGNNLKYKLYYISPFNEIEIREYLGKKFGEYTDSYLRAKGIVEKCNSLMVRPMVLNFIDHLLTLDSYRHINSSEIYQAIIDKWFEREIIICGNKVKVTKEELYSFSKKFALFVYEKWIIFSRAEVTQEEYNSFVAENGYTESPYSFKERSLLSRRDNGSVKFSHRSFWEFFIAINAIENPGVSFCANGMDAAISFYKEIVQMYRSNLKLHCVKPYIPHVLIGVDNLIPALENNKNVFVALSQKGENVQYEEVMDAFYSMWGTIIQMLLYKRFYFLKKSLYNLKASGNVPDEIKVIQALQITNHLEKTSSLYEDYLYIIFKYCYAALCSKKDKQHKLVEVISKVLNILQDAIYRIKNDRTGDEDNPLEQLSHLISASQSFFKEKREAMIFPESSYIKLYRDNYLKKDDTIDDCIFVGLGFNDDNTIITFVNDLFSAGDDNGLETVCIYKKVKNVEEAVSFVKNLNDNTSTGKDIIYMFDICDDTFYYVTNNFTREYSEDVIKRAFDNMIAIENRR